MRITVLSTFDVWPPRDGGQTRYVNLWRNFPREHDIKIVAYDFRNTSGERRYRIDEHVEVIVPPAARDDAARFQHMLERTLLWLHDVLCLRDYGFSTAFLTTLRHEVRRCDVLVASHPYLAHVAFPMASPGVTRVYESHNVEHDIKADYFATGREPALLAPMLDEVRRSEGRAAAQAHHVTAVSEADRLRFIELYGLPADKVSVVPNGANVGRTGRLTAEERDRARRMLGLGDDLVGIFLGSAYEANVKSYERARLMLKEAGFRGTMLLVGSIAQVSRTGWPDVGFDERWLGFVEDSLRDLLLGTADFALHLMFGGAGTNLKLFDYMGAGLPIVANAFGGRGVDGQGWCWPAETSEDLGRTLLAMSADPAEARRRALEARRIASAKFDWAAIARRFEGVMMGHPPGSARSGPNSVDDAAPTSPP